VAPVAFLDLLRRDVGGLARTVMDVAHLWAFGMLRRAARFAAATAALILPGTPSVTICGRPIEPRAASRTSS